MMSRFWQLTAMPMFAFLIFAAAQASGEPPVAEPSATAAEEKPKAADSQSEKSQPEKSQPEKKAQPEKSDAAKGWKPLEIRPDGSWVECRFGGDGPIAIKDGVISLGFGDPLTGVRWEGPFPRLDYEISLEARRTGGFDFFCGLTVPVGDQRCSLILGGWGGSLMGISSIDGLDAANNETTLFEQFEQNRWYKVRMRVTKERLQAWLDDEEIVNVEPNGRPLDIRGEMEETTPVGIAAFQCESQIRNVRVRPLAAPANDSGDSGDKAPQPPSKE